MNVGTQQLRKTPSTPLCAIFSNGRIWPYAHPLISSMNLSPFSFTNACTASPDHNAFRLSTAALKLSGNASADMRPLPRASTPSL